MGYVYTKQFSLRNLRFTVDSRLKLPVEFKYINPKTELSKFRTDYDKEMFQAQVDNGLLGGIDFNSNQYFKMLDGDTDTYLDDYEICNLAIKELEKKLKIKLKPVDYTDDGYADIYKA